jgi:hypothetical protein
MSVRVRKADVPLPANLERELQPLERTPSWAAWDFTAQFEVDYCGSVMFAEIGEIS